MSIKNTTFLALFVLGVATLSQNLSPLGAADKNIARGPSGLQLPRRVALQAKKVHLRTGPGTHYPIDWVYYRETLPMEVIDEHGPWRKVRDIDDTVGWIHRQLLIGPRYALIRGKTRTLFAEKDLTSARLVIAETGVTGRLLTCEDAWCQLIISGKKGWMERRHLWGVYKNETFD